MATDMLMENGRVGGARKSLAMEIDRLDNILDGFADALNEAVEMAVKASVRQAAVDVLREELAGMLTDQEALKRLREALLGPVPAPMNEAPTARGWQVFKAIREDWNGIRVGLSERWNAACLGVSQRWTDLCVGVSERCGQFRQGCADLWAWVCGRWEALVATVWAWVLLVWFFRREVLLAAGFTVAVSALATIGGPLVIGLLAVVETFGIALVLLLYRRALGSEADETQQPS